MKLLIVSGLQLAILFRPNKWYINYYYKLYIIFFIKRTQTSGLPHQIGWEMEDFQISVVENRVKLS